MYRLSIKKETHLTECREMLEMELVMGQVLRSERSGEEESGLEASEQKINTFKL